MGIDVHALNFLRYCKEKKQFGNTLMLGRQENHVDKSVLANLNVSKSLYSSKYSEDIFIEVLSSTSIHSLDYSNYEGAEIIADLTGEIPQQILNRFDTVFDGGVLEHVYSIPQALLNVSKLTARGGQIIHVLPANNFCGHGFWQFSPELFFSLYSEKNGYKDTEVFLADLTNCSIWYRVIKPAAGKRTFSLSSQPLYALVRTTLSESGFSHKDIQQSDYVHAWDSQSKSGPSVSRKASRKNRFVKKLRRIFLPKSVRLRQERSITVWNPWLEVVEVDSLIGQNCSC